MNSNRVYRMGNLHGEIDETVEQKTKSWRTLGIRFSIANEVDEESLLSTLHRCFINYFASRFMRQLHFIFTIRALIQASIPVRRSCPRYSTVNELS